MMNCLLYRVLLLLLPISKLLFLKKVSLILCPSFYHRKIIFEKVEERKTSIERSRVV